MREEDPIERRDDVDEIHAPTVSIRKHAVRVSAVRDQTWSEIRPGTITTWEFPLVTAPNEQAWMRTLLDAYELQRADRFLFDKHRTRFIVAHAMLRTLLAPLVGLAADQLEWRYAALGKPSLPDGQNARGLQFNLSHSGDLGFLAVTRSAPIGADIEAVRPMRDPLALAKAHFSATEFERLRHASSHQPFFRYWTRKEALLKATGKGLSGGLKNFCTAGTRDAPFGSVVACRKNAEPLTGTWYYFDCPTAPDYLASIVSNFCPRTIVCHRLHW